MKNSMISKLAIALLFLLIIPAAVTDTACAEELQDLEIKLTPHNPPLYIQPSGGNLDYSIDVSNLKDIPESFDVWTSALLPGGGETPPLSGPYRFHIPSGWSAYKELSQHVTGGAPAGPYSLKANVGIFPSVIWTSDTFPFEKLLESSAWYPQTSGTRSYLLGIYFTDSMNGWAAGITNTILHTDDGGDNWYPQSPAPSTNYYDLFFTDSLTGWAVGSSGKIVSTTDGGSTWHDQESGTSNGLYGVHFVDPDNGWAVGGRHRSFTPPNRFILHTVDGGQTWETQYFESDRDPLQDIVFTDPMNGWAVGESGAVLHTSDAGSTWTEQDSGTPWVLYSVHFTDSLSGWAVGASGTAIRTADGGNTWVSQDLGTSEGLSDVHFANPMNGWIAGGNTEGMILRTADGGNSWHPQDTGTDSFLSSLFFIDENTGWAAGIDGTILHTLTGGE